jgi:hypothetical protein
MKSIKTYEAFFKDPKYNIGDYVIVKDVFDAIHFGKVLDFNKVAQVYRIDIFNMDKDSFLFSADKVLRKMTPEEIEKVKMKKNINKYNL